MSRTKVKAKKAKKIIWTVDAFDTINADHTKVPELLKAIGNSCKIEIDPVYVLSPYELEVSVDFTAPWINHYKPAAEASLNQKLKNVKIEGLLPGKVIIQNKHSLTSNVKSLVNYAKNESADMIVLSTHARKGLSRLILGSFAESLILNSKVPVMTLNSDVKVSKEIQKILFPTDFSSKSKDAFKNILSFAKDTGASVTILHSLSNPIEPVFQSGVYLLGGGWVSVPAYLDKERDKLTQLGETWAKEGNKQGVKTTFLLDTKNPSVIESVHANTKSGKPDLIAIAAQSGRVASALIGSITREVVRTANCPVLVIREK